MAEDYPPLKEAQGRNHIAKACRDQVFLRIPQSPWSDYAQPCFDEKGRSASSTI
jgi:hypothetical protein